MFKEKKEKYVGVKFKTVFQGDFNPDLKQKVLIKQLISAGKFFTKIKAIDQNGGNLSVRSGNGFIIKRAGAHPNKLTISDFIFVKKTTDKMVYVLGKRDPSSEARLHQKVYQKRPDINCILHAHDFKVLKSKKRFAEIAYLPKISYGTLESAQAVSKLVLIYNYFVQKEHGIIALGKDVKSALNLIKFYHAQS